MECEFAYDTFEDIRDDSGYWRRRFFVARALFSSGHDQCICAFAVLFGVDARRLEAHICKELRKQRWNAAYCVEFPHAAGCVGCWVLSFFFAYQCNLDFGLCLAVPCVRVQGWHMRTWIFCRFQPPGYVMSSQVSLPIKMYDWENGMVRALPGR